MQKHFLSEFILGFRTAFDSFLLPAKNNYLAQVWFIFEQTHIDSGIEAQVNDFNLVLETIPSLRR